MAVSMKNDVHEVYRSIRETYASIFRVEEYAYQDTSVKQVALLATYFTFDELHGVTSQKTLHEVYCLLDVMTWNVIDHGCPISDY
jgi:hypothetical protein